MSTDPHPELAGLLEKLPPGRHAGGLLNYVEDPNSVFMALDL